MSKVKEGLLLKIMPKTKNYDYVDMVVKMANGQDVNFRDYDISKVDDVIFEFKDDFINHIIKFGWASVLNRSALMEAIVERGETKNQITALFKHYLDDIGIDDELIILDPYFYAAVQDSNSYVNLIVGILSGYFPGLKHIITITGNKIDSTLKQQIEAQLKLANPNLIIDHKTTSEWHDRFWISNSRKQGIITGTSLNGFGLRYALIDKVKEADISEIIDILTQSRLL